MVEPLPSKQAVASSNLVSRSTLTSQDPALVFPNFSAHPKGPYGRPMLTKLSEAVSAYRMIAAADGKSPKTIEWVTGSVRLFQKFLDRDPDLSSVTRTELREFILDLQQRPAWQGHPTIHGATRRVSKTTINTYSRGIRAFFATLEREEFIAPHDISKARVPKAPIKQIVPFTESELKAIFGAIGTKGPLSARNRAMALLLLDPGLRVSEACGLSDDDVDLSEMQITVTGKGGRDRLLPLSRWATKALLVYKVKARPEPVGCDNFFLTKEGIPVTPSAVEQMLTRVGTRTGVRRVTPHRFRHSFALLFLRNGGDSFHLQRLLGHSTLEMTRRYTRLADVDIKEAHRKFSPSDRLRL